MTTSDACAAHTFTARGLARGASASVALGLASSVLGAGVGVAARQAGLPLWGTVLMSGSVFAGAAQFAALTLWVAPLPYAPIWLSTFAVNARFALLTASLSPWLRHYRGWVQGLSTFLMGEGQWAIASNAHLRGERDIGVFVGSGLVVWFVWMTGTTVGYLAAPVLGDPRRLGLDLVLVLFFAATLTTTWRGRRDLVPWGAAALATRLSPWMVPPEWQVLVAALVGATVGAWRDAHR
ncbi:MAG: AzlC family ABC transporter permease [Vicinamibacterales bacterium]